MKQEELNITYKVAEFVELTPIQSQLVEEARQATFRAYAPYSNFSVGAAILLSNGEIVVGSNQENASFPAGTCAERSACFYAGAKYPEATFKAIAIAARDTSGEYLLNPISPCGVCRQALLEYETRAENPIEVILVGREKVIILPSVSSLLPFAFAEFN